MLTCANSVYQPTVEMSLKKRQIVHIKVEPGIKRRKMHQNSQQIDAFCEVDLENMDIDLLGLCFEESYDGLRGETWQNSLTSSEETTSMDQLPPPKGYMSAFNFYAKEKRAELLKSPESRSVRPIFTMAFIPLPTHT